jgi:2-dehydropantoate 2-reductase
MKILVFGAGVLGSVYAAKLQQGGQDVTVLARGDRLQEIKERGILLREQGSESVVTTPVRVIEAIDPDERYDWILVVVRCNQLADALEMLRADVHSPNVLFLLNNPWGWQAMADALGKERVVLGFPCTGGMRAEGVVTYLPLGAATTLGELDGQTSERLLQLSAALEQAGLPVEISPNMDAWLKTHAVVIAPLAAAVYMAGGSTYRLAETRDALVLMVRAVKEGLAALDRLEIAVTPRVYRLLRWLPEPLLVAVLRKGLTSERAELGLARHANAARDEMTALSDGVRALIKQSGQPAPNFEALYRFVDPAARPVPQGSQTLPMDWTPLIKAFLVLVLVVKGLKWCKKLCQRGRKCC